MDNAPTPRANDVDDFVSKRERLELVKLPPYSPDLNSIETVWREVKKEAVYKTFYRLFDESRNRSRTTCEALKAKRLKAFAI